MSEEAGRLYVVATPIGNLGDISERARDVLDSVEAIACEDTRSTRKLLNHFKIKKTLISCHSFNEQAIVQRIVGLLDQGQDIALVSEAGTPAISDPGFRLVRACQEAGVKVVAVPGASAVTAALSVSGLPADQFLFLGFLPRRGLERRQRFEEIAASLRTVLFFESPNRIAKSLAELGAIIGHERRVMVAREMSKLFEESQTKPLGQWLEEPPRPQGEFTILVAPAEAADRKLRIRRRFEMLKDNTELDDQQIFEVLAVEFSTSKKRLAYLLKEKPKE